MHKSSFCLQLNSLSTCSMKVPRRKDFCESGGDGINYDKEHNKTLHCDLHFLTSWNSCTVKFKIVVFPSRNSEETADYRHRSINFITLLPTCGGVHLHEDLHVADKNSRSLIWPQLHNLLLDPLPSCPDFVTRTKDVLYCLSQDVANIVSPNEWINEHIHRV